MLLSIIFARGNLVYLLVYLYHKSNSNSFESMIGAWYIAVFTLSHVIAFGFSTLVHPNELHDMNTRVHVGLENLSLPKDPSFTRQLRTKKTETTTKTVKIAPGVYFIRLVNSVKYPFPWNLLPWNVLRRVLDTVLDDAVYDFQQSYLSATSEMLYLRQSPSTHAWQVSYPLSRSENNTEEVPFTKAQDKTLHGGFYLSTTYSPVSLDPMPVEKRYIQVRQRKTKLLFFMTPRVERATLFYAYRETQEGTDVTLTRGIVSLRSYSKLGLPVHLSSFGKTFSELKLKPSLVSKTQWQFFQASSRRPKEKKVLTVEEDYELGSVSMRTEMDNDESDDDDDDDSSDDPSSSSRAQSNWQSGQV